MKIIYEILCNVNLAAKELKIILPSIRELKYIFCKKQPIALGGTRINIVHTSERSHA